MQVEATTIFIPVILFLATLSRSTFGFGDAMISMPLLSLMIDIKMATPLVALTSGTIAMAIVIRDWHKIDLKSARRLAFSAMIGIPIGLLFLKQVDDRAVKTVLAVVVLCFSIYLLWRPRFHGNLHERWIYLAGFFAGILGGAYNTHGPPLVIYATLQKWTAETLRATLQGYFVMAGAVLLVSHYLVGFWSTNGSVNTTLFGFYGISLPAVFLGIILGRKLNRRFSNERFRRALYVLLLLIGVALLADSIFQ